MNYENKNSIEILFVEKSQGNISCQLNLFIIINEKKGSSNLYLRKSI